MAPLVDVERADWSDVMSQTGMNSISQSVAIISAMAICVTVWLTLALCGCCGDDKKKKMQEEADAAVLPPPPAPVSMMPSAVSPRGQLTRGKDGTMTDPPWRNRTPDSSPRSKQQIYVASGMEPSGVAAPVGTLAFADSKVFDKSGQPRSGSSAKPRQKTITNRAVGGGPAPETLALAHSNVFDTGRTGPKTQPRSGKPAPAGTMPIGTLALANSNVFDQK